MRRPYSIPVPRRFAVALVIAFILCNLCSCNVKMITDRKERRAARRRNDIIEAAMKVFAERGIRQATIKEIADAADIAEGTIYNYFASKDDLVYGMIDYLGDLDAKLEDYEAGLSLDFRTFFHRHLLETYAMMQERMSLIMGILPEIIMAPELRDKYLQSLLNPGVQALEENLKIRMEREEFPARDIPTTVRLMTSTMIGLMTLLATGDEVSLAMWNNPQKMADTFTSFICDGLLHLPPEKS